MFNNLPLFFGTARFIRFFFKSLENIFSSKWSAHTKMCLFRMGTLYVLIALIHNFFLKFIIRVNIVQSLSDGRPSYKYTYLRSSFGSEKKAWLSCDFLLRQITHTLSLTIFLGWKLEFIWPHYVIIVLNRNIVRFHNMSSYFATIWICLTFAVLSPAH